MSKKVYIFLADGFEDIEGLTVVDLMRRAGITITTVSIKNTKQITTAHSITMLTDQTFAETDFTDADMLVLPGGQPGTTNLGAFAPLTDLLKNFYNNGGRIAAICAAPTIFCPDRTFTWKESNCISILHGRIRRCSTPGGQRSRGRQYHHKPRPWNCHRLQSFPDFPASWPGKSRPDRRICSI